jgi:hypothetical protein
MQQSCEDRLGTNWREFFPQGAIVGRAVRLPEFRRADRLIEINPGGPPGRLGRVKRDVIPGPFLLNPIVSLPGAGPRET